LTGAWWSEPDVEAGVLPPGVVLLEWPNPKTKAMVQATTTAAPTAMITPQGVDRRAAY
jgi:hypothetical protein